MIICCKFNVITSIFHRSFCHAKLSFQQSKSKIYWTFVRWQAVIFRLVWWSANFILSDRDPVDLLPWRKHFTVVNLVIWFRWFKPLFVPLCCFLIQETLPHIVSLHLRWFKSVLVSKQSGEPNRMGEGVGDMPDCAVWTIIPSHRSSNTTVWSL